MANTGIASMEIENKAAQIQRYADRLRRIGDIAHDAEQMKQRLMDLQYGERSPEIRHVEQLLQLLELVVDEGPGHHYR